MIEEKFTVARLANAKHRGDASMEGCAYGCFGTKEEAVAELARLYAEHGDGSRTVEDVVADAWFAVGEWEYEVRSNRGLPGADHPGSFYVGWLDEREMYALKWDAEGIETRGNCGCGGTFANSGGAFVCDGCGALHPDCE